MDGFAAKHSAPLLWSRKQEQSGAAKGDNRSVVATEPQLRHPSGWSALVLPPGLQTRDSSLEFIHGAHKR